MEFENSLNQSLAEVFETQSDISKLRDKTEKQIKEAKVYLNKFKESDITYDELIEFLKIFYSGRELVKQIKRLEKLNETQVLTSLYSVVAHRMEKLERIKTEIEEITKGV
jgi:hypothetical protein